MNVETFVEQLGVDFYTGVPDSQLKSLCDYLVEQKGIGQEHIIAANEGNCTALAAGYHLATGKSGPQAGRPQSCAFPQAWRPVREALSQD